MVSTWSAVGAITGTALIAFVISVYIFSGNNHSHSDSYDDLTIHVDLPEYQKVSLVRHDGVSTNWGATSGQNRLVYFGFTSCPDVCPMGLTKIAKVIDQLNDRVYQVTPIFITIDPIRDTPNVIGKYLSNFHENMVGYTGSEVSVRKLTAAFKVIHQVSEGHESNHFYLMDHTDSIFFVGGEGRIEGLFDQSMSSVDIAVKIQNSMSAMN